MKIIILGCGRVGARLAQLLENSGNDVSIIDSDPASFTRLPGNFRGQTVLGTGIDVDVLKSAGIETADAFAAVTNFDNTNIMACEVAKEIFSVKQVLARIYDPGREGMYHQLGLETICPTQLVSTTACDLLLAGFNGRKLDLPDISCLDDETSVPGSSAQSTAPAYSNGAQIAGNGIAQQDPLAGVAHATTAQAENDDKADAGRGLRGLFRH